MPIGVSGTVPSMKVTNQCMRSTVSRPPNAGALQRAGGEAGCPLEARGWPPILYVRYVYAASRLKPPPASMLNLAEEHGT